MMRLKDFGGYMDTVYKLVRAEFNPEDGNVPTRYFSQSVGGAAKVEYFPNKIVYAPDWLSKMGYHLCVFPNWDDAVNWAEGVIGKTYPAPNNFLGTKTKAKYHFEIWECYGCEKVVRAHIADTDALEFGSLQYNSWSWPTGTEMYKGVMLYRMMLC